MKSTLLFLSMVLSTSIASAQYEVYGSGIAGDTVKLWDVNITSDCGSAYIASVTCSHDSLLVTEQDTSKHHATCTCYYDVQASITGLSAGTYTAVIYRVWAKKYQYPKDSTLCIGSFTVSVTKTSALTANTRIHTSNCHQDITSVNDLSIPNTYALLTNYPNPFNPATRIEYVLPQSEHVRLDVFDMSGRFITTLVEGKKSAGKYSVLFNGNNLASGVYICRMKAGTTVLSNKMILLK